MYRERYFYYRMNFLPIENTSFLSYSRYFIPPQYWHRFCISISLQGLVPFISPNVYHTVSSRLMVSHACTLNVIFYFLIASHACTFNVKWT